MITEKRFAQSHHGFWHDLMPMGEHYVRNLNLDTERFSTPMGGESPASTRGLVNEVGFRLFVASVESGVRPAELQPEAISAQHDGARSYIEAFRQHGRSKLPPLDDRDIREGVTLACRLHDFFAGDGVALCTLKPAFRGCGWLSECEGDVLRAGALYEVKAGARTFRAVDLRQIMVYCALNFASKQFNIDAIGLANPREGVFFVDSLEGMCEAVAGRSSVEILGEIVEYISEAADRHVADW